MCGSSGIDDLLVVGDARRAADDLLTMLRVPLAKALDVSTPRGFDAAVARLAARLRAIATPADSAALREAIAVLDVDWRTTTAMKRSALVREAMRVAGRATANVAHEIRAPLGKAATAVVESTRTGARRRHRLAIGAELNAIDRRATDYVTRANVLFVRDEYGRRLDALGERARGVVARGLEQGLGREAIAEDLATMAEAVLVGRARSYWDVVAASFVGEARSLSQISGYAEAAIERYVLLAVLDEHTTDACRFLDGKVLQTADALRTFERLDAAEDPLTLKRERPWVRERTGENGKRRLVVDRDGDVSVLAVVDRSGLGARDDRGVYSRALSGRELAPAGIGFPPFHGFCRTTTVPDS
jgi:hypothetical protein